MKYVDLNCDMGESTHLYPYRIENDLAILQHISSVNIACGLHAGDAYTMHRLVETALNLGVAVGAHPSFPNRENFGRSDQYLEPAVLYDTLVYQIAALQGLIKVCGGSLFHVKAHGALYNLAARDAGVADTVCRAVKDLDDRLYVYVLSGSEMIAAARRAGLKTASEVFIDRTYQENGLLTPRTQPGALIEDETGAISQALQMVQEGTVTATNGKTINVQAETICLHGDGRFALKFARSIHEVFLRHDIQIRRPNHA